MYYFSRNHKIEMNFCLRGLIKYSACAQKPESKLSENQGENYLAIQRKVHIGNHATYNEEIPT